MNQLLDFNLSFYDIIINTIPRKTKYHFSIKLYKFVLIALLLLTLNHELNLYAIRRLLNSTNSSIPKYTPEENLFKTNNYFECGKAFEEWAFNFSTNNYNLVNISKAIFIFNNDNWNINNNEIFTKKFNENITIDEIRKIIKDKNNFLSKIMNKLNLKPEDFFKENFTKLKSGSICYSQNYYDILSIGCFMPGRYMSDYY